MKHTFYLMFLFVMGNAVAMEAAKKITLADYSQEDLVLVRVAWAYQENRLGQLKYEAVYIARNSPLDYFSGNVYVATLNASDQTITTYIGQDKSVKLSYEDFNKLLADKTIAELADQCLQSMRDTTNRVSW